MLSKRYESTEVDRRTWLHVPSGTDWSTSSDTHQNRESTEGYSSKHTASSRNLVSTIGAKASPKKGTKPGVQKGKRPLLACYTFCKCSLETTHNSVKVKVGIKVMKLVESLIGSEVTVDQ